MQLPLVYLDASAVEEIPLDAWHELFDAVGWPSSLEPSSLGHDSIGASLVGDEPSEGLLLALESIYSLGTSDGREALLGAMHDRHVDSAQIPEGCGEREFALRAFLLRQAQPAFVDVFARAQIHVQAVGNHQAINEHWGASAKVVKSITRSKARLMKLMLAHCKAHDLGEHVQVEAVEDDGACVFQVYHSDRMRTPLAIVDGSVARSRFAFRPVHCDVIRYDAVTGRMQVAARRASMVTTYVQLMGDALFDDPTFFVGDAACTLQPLQEKGRSALGAHKLAGIGLVWMTEFVWERGDRDVHRVRSRDCFDEIEDLKLPIEEGTLVEVKLKLQVAQKGTRPVTVTVRLPGKIKVSSPCHEQLAHEYLEAIGVRCRAGVNPALDLWSLHPWRRPHQDWRAVFGDQVEELCKAGALVPVELESVAHPELRGAGSALDVHAVDGGGFYGVGKEDEFASKSLSATDVQGLELKASAFRTFLVARLGLPELTTPVESDVLDLGTVRIGEHSFRPFYALSTPRDGFGARARKAAAGDSIVLLLPAGRTTGSEIAEAELRHPIPSKRELERALVIACGLEGCVPAIHFARDGTQLIVDTQHGVVWVHEVEVPGLKPDTHPFRFVEELARASPGPVSSEQLSRQLSKNRDDDSTAARKAKSKARRAITEALASAGMSLGVDDPFPTVPGGAYKCALAADVY